MCLLMLKSVKWGKDSQRFWGKRTHDEATRPTLEMAWPTRYFKISMTKINWEREDVIGHLNNQNKFSKTHKIYSIPELDQFF